MDTKTNEEFEVDRWIATIDAAAFHEKLSSETDEFRYRILAALLANELKEFEPIR
jgi:hypothetical protein